MNFIFNKYQSIKKIFLQFRLVGLFDYVLKFLKLVNKKKIQLVYNNKSIPELQRIRINLNNQIFKLLKNKIFSGPYKNTKIINDFKKTYHIYRTQQILGTYELNIQQYAIMLQKKYKLKNIVSFGSDNGFHPLGLIKNSEFKKAYCFEKSKSAQQTLIDNFKLNNAIDKLQCFEEANFKKVFNLLDNNELKKTLFIIDIEGDEYKILNDKILKKIKNSFLIIENHDFTFKNKKKIRLVKKSLKEKFKIKILNNSFPEIKNFIDKINLSQEEIILSIFENRKKMNWFICEPKK